MNFNKNCQIILDKESNIYLITKCKCQFILCNVCVKSNVFSVMQTEVMLEIKLEAALLVLFFLPIKN